MNNPVGWFEIYVDDMPRAKTFYEAVFGATLEQLQAGELEMWAFPMQVNQSGASGSLVKMPGFSAGRNSVIIYFSSENCEHEEARVVAAGGKIEKPKMSIGQYGFISLVYDTEGNMIGLHSMQ